MEKKSNGGLIALVIMLGLLVCAMGGYIAYDKLENKQEEPNKVQNNEQDTKELQKVNIANLYKSVDLDYAINGKIVKVGFNYTIEKGKDYADNDEYKVYITLSFDGKLKEDKYYVAAYDTENKYKNADIYELIGRRNLNIIKGNDKEYFVFYISEMTEGFPKRTLLVLNEDGSLVHNVKFEQGNSFSFQGTNYANYDLYYLTNDAIYYIDNSCGKINVKYEIKNIDDEVIYVLDEYKLTIENGKAKVVKNGTQETTLGAGQIC